MIMSRACKGGRNGQEENHSGDYLDSNGRLERLADTPQEPGPPDLQIRPLVQEGRKEGSASPSIEWVCIPPEISPGVFVLGLSSVRMLSGYMGRGDDFLA